MKTYISYNMFAFTKKKTLHLTFFLVKYETVSITEPWQLTVTQ